MGWKNIRLRYKLLMTFGLVLILLMIIGGIGYIGVGTVTQNAKAVILGHQLDGLLAQKEVDHLIWASKVLRMWADEKTNKIDVQTNDHECAFGKWLYGEDRKQLEAAYPDIAPSVAEIELPHRQLHTSVIEINQIMAAQSERATGVTTASIVLREKTLPALAKVQELLHVIRKSASDKIMTDQAMLDKAKSTRRDVSIITVIAVVAGLLLALFIASSISRPTVQAAAFVDRLSQGDFTQMLPINQKDEIGQLAASLNHLVTSLAKMIRVVNNGVATLNSTATEFHGISEEMNQSAEKTSEQANTVAAATEELSANMNNVAAASEEATNNLNIMATAAEEMSSTVHEIAQNSEKARAITSKAVTQTQSTFAKVDELSVAANEISKVTEVITQISDQTNLLALNATIEAARAGEAGKGFAVVANEIKELAKQTAQATQEIKKKIEDIQSSTHDTVDMIKQISEVIVEVDEIVSNIATAVEGQSVATEEIANNVSQASQGIQEVNINVSQISTVTSDVSKEISGVNLAAKEMATSSSQIFVSAQDLQKQAGRLTQAVTHFKVTPARFDIGAIKGAHLKWRSRLEGLLHGRQTLKPEEVANHHQCAFGKWYDSPESQALKAVPAFAEVGRHHEKVHSYAREIVDLFHRNEKEKAAALMASFEDVRVKLFDALDELYMN